ncbi:M20/M25/M40 family metallo-hydrolase [Candidatus Woesearchaeota archaeon]|jgi:acetylornithine deacetylase/succinyl-diaminopimelate desuccinylase-like protein|nr:M20/M25/M40 family metallo-hydrolase [Candidatus Woesearchaeota archaeon]MBT3537124.1 M20/M25/M40 family metallo-hydrolase [Candidatus Woesearchaeota archaeon]MBT4696959.1 M20/M25/M40 family metallo-hydrolase [Candidatus Woesearchaeota archaeon]MBT4716546.1 M20/M25/M40 family metallo-hydrolase [Candidatus Woesearchaeota archaeon]MBT7106566.1 M20/M25/M40 family metallo-hydrolase [Candidatus Woesearchaeota archaeon]
MNPVELTKELVSINSANPFKTIKVGGQTIGIGNEQEIVKYLEKKLISAGFSVKKQLVQEEEITEDERGRRIVIPQRYNLLAEKGIGDSSLLFFGHIDTVDVKNGWSSDPFEPTIKIVDGKERIYGLGSNDMKGGISTIVAATSRIDPKEYKIKVAFLADEEFWSFGAVELLKSDFLDDVKAAIVPEIGESDRRTNSQGIILGRMGRTEYHFSITGKAAHGALARESKDAINAIHESVKLQKKIIEYCEKCEKEFSHGNIHLKNSAFINHHDGGKGILSISENASFNLDRSFVMNENMDEEINILRNIVKECHQDETLNPNTKVEISERRATPAAKPYFVSPEHPFVKFVTKKVMDHYGNYEYGIGYSVADENRIANLNIPTIVLGPIGSDCHSPDEWVDVESLNTLTKTYIDICESFPRYLAEQ